MTFVCGERLWRFATVLKSVGPESVLIISGVKDDK